MSNEPSFYSFESLANDLRRYGINAESRTVAERQVIKDKLTAVVSVLMDIQRKMEVIQCALARDWISRERERWTTEFTIQFRSAIAAREKTHGPIPAGLKDKFEHFHRNRAANHLLQGWNLQACDVYLERRVLDDQGKTLWDKWRVPRKRNTQKKP